MMELEDLIHAPTISKLIADGTLPPDFAKLTPEAGEAWLKAAREGRAGDLRHDRALIITLVLELGLRCYVEREAGRRKV